MSLSRNSSIDHKGSYCPVVKLEFKISRIEQLQLGVVISEGCGVEIKELC